MMKNDAVLLHTPTKLVRASGRLPKVLTFKDTEGDGTVYFIEPEIEGDDMKTAKIFYTLPTKFARECLAQQDRFALVSPARMLIKVNNKGTYDSSTKIVHAIEVKRSGKILDEMAVQDLEVKREEIKIAEHRDLAKGDVPEHLKAFVTAPVAPIPPKAAPAVEESVAPAVEEAVVLQDAPAIEEEVLDLTGDIEIMPEAPGDVTTF